MMLTVKQPLHYGYKPFHDLPTPPRSSPPVTILDAPPKSNATSKLHRSPPTQSMSAPHRGLPLPAAMALNPPPPPGHPLPPTPSSGLQAQAPVVSSHSQSLGPLPPPPQWQGSEESMRNWLLTKAEEERRRQEEEKTRQESLRLEQRRIENEMLRTSLDRGIPPSMVPVVFAGMSGGILPQATLDFLHQQLLPQHHHGQASTAQAPLSPEHRRDSQQYASYGGSSGVPPTPVSGAGPQVGFVPYQGPGSPTRARAQTMTMGGPATRPVGALGGSALPRLSTGEGSAAAVGPSHGSHGAQQQQVSATQQDTQPSPSIYFHHWQPPTSQAGSGQQGASSVDSPKKRKATGPHQAPPPPSRRSRSPPFGQFASTSTISVPPPGRRGHSRQRSDISAYGAASRTRDILGPHRGFSPGVGHPVVSTSRETTFAEPSHQPRSSAHSVSSLLSDQPSPRFMPETRVSRPPAEGGYHSRAASEERERGAPPPPPPPPTSRERGKD
ncbi:hypothetical protein GGR57DRAFT_111803 [Xylariaceae sp. FL1272]|nr:hypothetical protein GGR57DRAFT_111803 [Xylariaceae sp. FL1272]